MIILIFIAIIIIAVLIYSEYVAHDCIPGKLCSHRVKSPNIHHDDPLEYTDKIRKMVKNNYEYVSWRQALLVAIITSYVVIYFITKRSAFLYEWMFATLIIFITAYLSFNWIWSHFFFPNSNRIEKSLLELKDKLYEIYFQKHY